MKHRREIDGLRALAVLPVILFHAGFATFGGGFIGVDIFFVISGYLITGIIIQDLAQGRFSIRRFYARRARRILPALFFVTLACIPVAFVWMLPSQYEDFSRSLVAVVLFVSNIFFWRESGYFAEEAAEKPLLHTWSLGVEEQYYLLFPLVLLLLWRLGKNRAYVAVVAMAFFGLALSEYASRYFINANFFLLPTRAWELLAGAICAFLHKDAAPGKNNYLSALGLGLIIFSVTTYNEQMRLPSVWTLAPVLGTALILLYGTTGSYVARLLSMEPLVGIGLISYSAYLWHQPLFALAHVRSDNLINSIDMAVLVAAAFLLAMFTLRFVEQPFRYKQHRFYVSNRYAIVAALMAAGVIIAFGSYGYFTDGRLEYWEKSVRPSQARAYHLFSKAREYEMVHFSGIDDNGDCIFRINSLNDGFASRIAACSRKYGEGIAIIGDSHAVNSYFVLKHHAVKQPFIVGISLVSCRAHTPEANCYYQQLTALLQKYPHLFRDIIYEQSGSYLIGDGMGNHAIWNLPLDSAVPNYQPYMLNIDKVADYLAQLSRYGRVTWFGPRIEPQIREKVIINRGCDYRYRFRPNQAQVFIRLDAAIKERMAQRAIRYRSQIDRLRLDITQDLINCDTLYFVDKTHYSIDGEQRFGERIKLHELLGR